MSRRRSPHPLATAAGLVLVIVAVGYGITGVGWCIQHATDAVLGCQAPAC